MNIIQIKIIIVIKCATDRQPQNGGATSHPLDAHYDSIVDEPQLS
jgi:hypothetical protein